MMRARILFLLLILAGGCLRADDGGGFLMTTSPEGVRFTSFAPDKNPVQSGEEIAAFTQVQNIGGHPAKDVKVCIKRAGEFVATCQSGGCAYNCGTASLLSAPDERIELPGDTHETYWLFKAPSVSFPTDQDIVARVSYNYSTMTTMEIPILTNERLTEIQQGSSTFRSGTTTSTLAPVTLQIQTADPITVDQTGKRTFNFDIVISNSGIGIIKSYSPNPGGDCGDDSLNCVDSVEVELLGDESDTISCGGSEGQKVTVENTKLWKGDSARVNCEMSVDLGDDIERYPILQATAHYIYHLDKKLNMKVQP